VSEKEESRPSEEIELKEQGNRPLGETEKDKEMKREEESERADTFKRTAFCAWGGVSQPPVHVESMGLQTSFLSPRRRLGWWSWLPWPWTRERKPWGSP
jgi:hypothetical protein